MGVELKVILRQRAELQLTVSELAPLAELAVAAGLVVVADDSLEE